MEGNVTLTYPMHQVHLNYLSFEFLAGVRFDKFDNLSRYILRNTYCRVVLHQLSGNLTSLEYLLVK